LINVHSNDISSLYTDRRVLLPEPLL